LDRAEQEESGYFTESLMSAPEIHFLRSDPRLQGLLRRSNLLP